MNVPQPSARKMKSDMSVSCLYAGEIRRGAGQVSIGKAKEPHKEKIKMRLRQIFPEEAE
jgi:hypothetical protein